MTTPSYPTRPGTRFPPGINVTADGVNFCIFSRHAIQVELKLYAAGDSIEAFQVIALQPEHNRSFFFWHVFVVGLPAGTYYTWQMDGPNDPSAGRRFYPDKELLDPWARAVFDRPGDRRQGTDPNGKDGGLRAIVVSSLSPLVPTTTALQTGPI
jgi:isoamylase